MEKKLAAFVLIASLAGLSGGYCLGFAIYQPQILRLQSDMSNLQSTLSQTELNVSKLQTQIAAVEESLNRTWRFVASFTLRQNRSSDFLIQGEKWRIRYDAIVAGYFSGAGGAGFKVIGEQIIHYFDQLHEIRRGILYVAHGQGSYYLMTVGLNSPIAFTIESYH